MRRTVWLLGAGLATLALVASDTRVRAQATPGRAALSPAAIRQAVRVGESAALRDLPDESRTFEDVDQLRSGSASTKVIRNHSLPKNDRADLTVASGGDAALQPTETPSELTLTAPTSSFDGLSSQENFNMFGFRVSPPDTVGDVGPAHYVQMTNLLIRVWNKAGTPLTAPAKTSTFWASLGGICATDDLGDPIVVYDDMADRFLISQFNSEDFDFGPHHQCIAISTTGDPTGTWHQYDFVMPNLKFNDYPKFGVWRDAYYMTDNQFAPFFAGAGAFAFDRRKMLLGDPTASYIYFDLEAFDPFIGGVLPADADGIVTPPAGSPGVFSMLTADEFLDPEGDALRVFELHADFDNPAASTFSEPNAAVPVLAFDPRSPVGRRDIEQPPPAVMPTNAVDSLQDRLMHRLQYRNFGAYETLVVTHTVNVGTGTTLALHQSGIRYYELTRTGGGPWTVKEQATYSPDTDNRWMGSAAMDGAGNLAVGYSVSSLTTFPSIRYAARLAGDPPGGLHQGERSLVAGSGVQRSTSNRWGDYSALTIDPVDDCTFWYTQEYYTAASQASSVVGWLTRIGSFKADEKCQASARSKLDVTVVNCENGQLIDDAFIEVSNGMSRVTVDGQGGITLPAGTYTVKVSAFGYQPTERKVTVGANRRVRISICLKPISIVKGVSFELSSEGCKPPNNAIDPGEPVSVRFTLQNVGTRRTNHLRAALLPGGGVSSPSGAQLYGSLAPGESATRSFAFQATGTCGSLITMSLALTDGPDSLGGVQFTSRLGERVEFPAVTAANTSSIAILDNSTAAPYPSTIAVAGASGTIDKVTVTLTGFSHTFPSDTIFVLVGPTGQAVTLMAFRGNGIPVSNVNLTFDDDAGRAVPAPMVSGVWRPSPSGVVGPLPSPAPPAPYAGTLGAFKGTDPNGTWKLFALDTFNLDSGAVNGGWSLTINAIEYRCATQCSLGTK